MQLDATSAFAGNPFFKSSDPPKDEVTTIPPVAALGTVPAPSSSDPGGPDDSVFSGNPFLKKPDDVTTAAPPPTLPPAELDVDVRRSDGSPYGDVCGRPTVANSLVVRGEPVPRGAYPWLVAMFWTKNLGPEFRCSGSLVSDRHVVTGGWCAAAFVRRS